VDLTILLILIGLLAVFSTKDHFYSNNDNLCCERNVKVLQFRSPFPLLFFLQFLLSINIILIIIIIILPALLFRHTS